MRFNRMIAVLLAGLLSSSIASAFDPPPFPRIGAILFGSPTKYDDPALQALLGHTSIALFSYWPGWETTHTQTFEQAMEAIKKLNPNIQLAIYSHIDATSNDAPFQPVAAKLNAMHWSLYPSGTTGSPVPSFWSGGGGPFYTINTTLFPAKDSDGHRYMDWYAAWFVSKLQHPNPSLNSFYIDNVFLQPRVTGDWDLDGVPDNPNDPTVGHWLHEGYNAYFSSLRAQQPGAYLIGNIAGWGAAGANLTDYNGQLNGGFIEGILGFTWSPEYWGGWQEMMNEYRKPIKALAAPQLIMFAMVGSPTDYQTFRYGLASCLMDNGYFVFSASDAYNDLHWFDEYNANLGTATSAPPTSAWQNGVYRRDFSNGIALVNPKGNGPRTVTLETSYKRISGAQVPTINNGQTLNTVTLQDRDGIILLRLQPIGAPKAPTHLSLSQ